LQWPQGIASGEPGAFFLLRGAGAQKKSRKTSKKLSIMQNHHHTQRKAIHAMSKNTRERNRIYKRVERATKAMAQRSLKCADCGSTERLQKHHEDYSKPLDVIILCPKCHAGRHRDDANNRVLNSYRFYPNPDLIRHQISDRQLSVADMARESGLGDATIRAALKKGLRGDPMTLKGINTLARALGVKAQDIST